MVSFRISVDVKCYDPWVAVFLIVFFLIMHLFFMRIILFRLILSVIAEKT